MENPEDGIGDMDFTYEDYLQVHQLIGLIYFVLGEYDKASSKLDFVLSNLPIMQINGEEEEVVTEFADAFFTRMRINIKNNNRAAVLKDFNKINGRILAGEEYERAYADVFEYLKLNDGNAIYKRW